jgi:hypothetical protein
MIAMSKSNKELAVEVAVALIQANPKLVRDNNTVVPALDLKSIINVIEAVNQSLDKIDLNRE